MVTYENECVGCPAEMGCLGDSCPHRNVRHLYCDDCDADCDELYIFDQEELCINCIIKRLETVKID